MLANNQFIDYNGTTELTCLLQLVAAQFLLNREIQHQLLLSKGTVFLQLRRCVVPNFHTVQNFPPRTDLASSKLPRFFSPQKTRKLLPPPPRRRRVRQQRSPISDMRRPSVRPSVRPSAHVDSSAISELIRTRYVRVSTT